MTTGPTFVPLVRCPRCTRPTTRVYRTDGRVQYRFCLNCDARFKTIRELPDDPAPPPQNRRRGL